MAKKLIASLLLLVWLFAASFALTNVNACGNLNTAGETYIVTTDPLSSADVCLNITANNVVLDCNGSTIDYTGAGNENHTAILINNANGVTVRNCITTDWDNLASAVRIQDSTGAVIRNLTTDTECYYAVKIDGDSASSFSLYSSNLGFSGVGVFWNNLAPDLTSAVIDGCTFDGGANGFYGIAMNAESGIVRNNIFHSIGLSSPTCLVILLGGSGNEYKVSNNTIYDFCHTAPFPGSISGGLLLFSGVHDTEVWNNTLYNSNAGWGLIDNFNFPTNNIFYSNTMHDLGGGGIFCMDTHGHTSYNNSLWNVTTGIEVVSNCVDARIYNNSVRNASTGLNISGKGAEVYENLASESNVGFAIDFPSTDSWINVHDNIAHSNTQAGFWLTEGGSPDQSYPFQNNVAWNNSLAGFLIAPKGDFPIMSENIARNNTIGVYFNGGTGGNFTDCESYENRLGVVFSGEKGSVYNCDIYDNTDNAPLGGTGTGVVFQESQENEVANSRIDGNNIGVFINKSTLDTLNGCNIFENSREAIWITRYAFSTRIVNTDSHDNEGATPPNGLYLVAGGGYPNLTMRNVRIFRNAGVALKMRDFTPSGDGDPAFILEDSIIYGGMQIISGDSGEITNTYFKNDPRGYYLSINEGGVPATQAIVGTNLGIGLPNSEAALGVGADTTRYAYIIYPAISLTKVTLQDATMGTNFASLNASGDAAEMNEDAEVHLRPNTCANLRYYFLDGYPTTFNEIVTNGAEFTPAASTCVGGWATFSVDHFTGYAAEGSAPPEEGGGEFECITAADCSPCEICYNHECILPQGACNIAADCPQSRAYNLQFLCENCACIPIECMEDSDCDEGYTCEENYCIPPECLSDSDCGENEICVNFECTGKGGAGEEKPGTGEAGEPGGPVTPPKPEEKPPFVVPVEIGESVIPLVEPGPEEKKEEWGIWQTVATAAAFAIAMLVLASLIYFLAAKKKKKKRKAEELE